MQDYEWYDHKKVQKLYDKQSKKYISLARNFIEAKNKGNQKAMEKASKALREYNSKNEEFKEKANQHYFYWH